MVSKGTKVVVVKGVKVPKGTTGEVFWVGDTKYGMRVGFKDAAGTVHWTAKGNVEPVDAPAPAPAAPAPDAFAALVARVAALEAALGLAAPAPVEFDFAEAA